MEPTYWFLVIGGLLVSVAIIETFLDRLPVSTSNIYLLVGVLLGPHVLGLLSWDAVRAANLLEHVTEIAVIVSLFTVGLNMRRTPTDRGWLLPIRLASITMIITIALVAAVGVWFLGLPLGAAVLLGAILAPTDPVLASDVQVEHPTDRDSLRYGLSGEAGLNDGTAFPFVMLGLGLLAIHPDQQSGLLGLWADQPFTLWGWLGWDVLWAVAAGLLVGGLTGYAVGRLVLHLRQQMAATFGLHAFLVLGLIALAYGLAELVYGYGFLAVFAAGYALRYLELRASNGAAEPAELPAIQPGDEEAEKEIAQQSPDKAAQHLALSLQHFNQQLEHILQAMVVVLIGGVLTFDYWNPAVLWLAPLLFLIVRPLAVAIGLIRSSTNRVQRGLIGWFGIRGIGSMYYLTYAIEYGLNDGLARQLTSLTLSMIAVSILVHGISVTPIMRWYERHKDAGSDAHATAHSTPAASVHAE